MPEARGIGGAGLDGRTPERRSQAERREITRHRIVSAVFESVAEVGLARTTAVEVTSRAGVTWGAVQHHFGGKDGMLLAAVETSFEQFASRTGSVSTEGATLGERASLFVDRAWAHFGSQEYRSAFEILLAYAARDDVDEPPTFRGRMFDAWDRVWMRIFRDSPLPRRRQLTLEQYTISVLTGLAATATLEGATARTPRAALVFLKDTLARELAKTG
jgi:AcrR family transcriptional regulator